MEIKRKIGKELGHASVVTVRSHLPSIFVFSDPQSIFILFFISSPGSFCHTHCRCFFLLHLSTALLRRCCGAVTEPSSPVELSRTSSTLQSASFSKESLSALFNIASVFFQSRKTKLPTLPPPVSNYPPAKPSRCAPNTSTSTIAAVPTQKEMSSTAPNEAHLALGCASKSADERATTAPNTAANRRDSLQKQSPGFKGDRSVIFPTNGLDIGVAERRASQ
ncbi:uncharacterized protein APUU_50997A [Aspergillus puulaauensis]|uniref:Uncharacterized protein n=1 Tax=Aspergillus puulaauensis TaxID=1220207 RepID=A0A7R7XRM2_9EURO|nr:uncharacterized protein APUU_50997A [Aspergillus puulaauensis]BCS26286.1 hypothetical protein APUU_50997A [Aspergillus puulaauensis]